MNTAQRRIAGALCAALIAGGTVPSVALADTSSELQAKLDQARTTLDSLYASAEAASNELNKTMDDLATTQEKIEDTSAQIEVRQGELVGAQKTLEQTVSTSYKDGNVSLLSILLSSTSFEDLLSRIYYANKVSESYNQQIRAVKDIQADLAQKRTSLEEERASLEQLQADQVVQRDQLAGKAAEAESYVSGLSAELKDALAAEQAAREEAARAQAAAAVEAANAQREADAANANKPADNGDTRENNAQNSASSSSSSSSEKPEPKEEERTEPQRDQEEEEKREEEESTPSESNESSSEQATSPAPVSNQDARTAVVNYVLAQVGKPYVWATHGPDSFDCSGLTGAAYDSIGYFVGYSDSYQVQFCNKPASEAAYGDIVWRPGHVGLCIGGGVTVEAFNPSRGVGYGSVDSFELAGSPLG
ncbi:MAG: C40 family peptidase [Atopobiaceae bacterium]|nr:C40 family peptidase [Atopobiaceae bacterium]